MFSKIFILILAFSNASLLCMEPALEGENLVLWKLLDKLGSREDADTEKWQSAEHKQLLDACKNHKLDALAAENYRSMMVKLGWLNKETTESAGDKHANSLATVLKE